MRIRHRLAGAGLVAAAAATLSGCGQQTIDGRATVAAPTVVASDTVTTTPPPTPTPPKTTPPAPPEPEPGPNGAPFDPCQIVTWADISTGTLTEEGPDGRDSAPDARPPQSGWLADCRFDDTIISVPNPFDEYPDDPNDKGTTTYWITHVLWTDSCSDCSPGAVLGRDGKQNLIDRSADTDTPSDQCVVTAKIADGYAAVSVFNERWKTIDPDTCARATSILGHVLERVP